MTTQTPDAVREATMVLDVFLAAYTRRSDDMPVYLDSDDDNLLRWGHLRTILAALDSRAGDAGEAVAWCSPGQLANLTDVDRDGGVYLPIRKTRRGNFTMPLFATPAPAVDAVPAGEEKA